MICQIPPHDVWISGFAGQCAVTTHLAPARRRIVIDRDPAAAEWWRDQNVEVYCCDAVEWLRHYFGLYRQPESPKAAAGPGCVAESGGLVPGRRIGRPCRTVVYADPPYPITSRRSGRRRYAWEMTDSDHADLLAVLLRLPCWVLVHSYPNPLYQEHLAGWRTWTYRAQTRGGPATEQVWANYPEPTELHDYRWIGRSKREREKLAKRRRRLIRWLDCLPSRERAQLLAAVGDRFGGSGLGFQEEPPDLAAEYSAAANG